MDLPGPGYLKIMVDYLVNLPRDVFDSRQPAQHLLVSTECPVDRSGRDGRIDVMSGQRAGLITWIVAHSGMGHAFELDLSLCFESSSQITARWLDPRTGAWIEANPVESCITRFQPPSSGSVKCDWVLEVQG